MSIEDVLVGELRKAVLAEIEHLGLDAETLAENLDLVPTAVRALLNREHWSLKTALFLADGLNLRIKVVVYPAPLERHEP